MIEHDLNSREPHHRFCITVVHPSSGVVYHAYFETLMSTTIAFQQTTPEWRPSFRCLTEDAIEEVRAWLATCDKNSA